MFALQLLSSKILFKRIDGLPTVKLVSFLKHFPRITTGRSVLLCSSNIKSANHSVCFSRHTIRLSYQSYERSIFLASQLKAILSLGWHPPPSPIPPKRYLVLINLSLARNNPFITLSQSIFSDLCATSIIEFAKQIFIVMYVLYETLIISASSIVHLYTGLSCIVE